MVFSHADAVHRRVSLFFAQASILNVVVFQPGPAVIVVLQLRFKQRRLFARFVTVGYAVPSSHHGGDQRERSSRGADHRGAISTLSSTVDADEQIRIDERLGKHLQMR